MKSLPRTLDAAEKLSVLGYFQTPHGLRLLESLLDTRNGDMVRELAAEITDPETLEDKIADLARPVRQEKEHIEYAKEFLRSVYAASFPNDVAPFPDGSPFG